MKSYRLLLVSIALVGLSAPAAMAFPTDFEPILLYPDVSGSVVADVLGDGRFILYDGNTVYAETVVDTGVFSELASGYLGDPAFIAVAPDGHRCLLGAGEVDTEEDDPSNDWVWLLDTNTPADAPPLDAFGNVSDGLALVTSNYWGTWLNDDLVLIERAPGWVSELGILDVSTQTYRKVVNKGGNSASLVLGTWLNQGHVFATIGYGTGRGTTRRFVVQDLIDVFDDPAYDVATSPLDWTDGLYIGSYPDFSAGPSASTDAGILIFGSHNSQILYVNPTTGEPLGAPVIIAGSTGRSVRPYYNPVTKRILVTETDWGGPPDWLPSYAAYISSNVYQGLPAAGGAGLAVLAGVLAVAARRRMS